MDTIQTKQQSRGNDVLFHLDKSISDLKTLQLDYNRNKEIFSVCNAVINSISISEQLLQSSNLLLPIEIANNVNILFIEDKSLSTVIVKISNSKRVLNHYPAILNIEI